MSLNSNGEGDLAPGFRSLNRTRGERVSIEKGSLARVLRAHGKEAIHTEDKLVYSQNLSWEVGHPCKGMAQRQGLGA